MTGAEPVGSENTAAVRELLKCGALCCDGTVAFQGDEVQHIGDPTETAIVLAAHRNGMPKEQLAKSCPRLFEIPFDSDRKRMSTVHRMEDGRLLLIVKGAFDMMAPLCTAGNLEAARRVCDDMSAEALRVLAVAYKQLDAVPDAPAPELLEQDLTLLGLVGMIDPPRPEARQAVETCRAAGIRPVMITGDHVVTASAIARELGIPVSYTHLDVYKRQGYIRMDRDGYITLTETGQEIADRMYERHTLLSNWLMRLGVDEQTAVEDACRIEHVISQQSFEKLRAHAQQQEPDGTV